MYSNNCTHELYSIHHFTTVDIYFDETTDCGGWLVIQRNKISSPVDFNRNWTDYEEGFGDLNTELWYGLSVMHCLTQRGDENRL